MKKIKEAICLLRNVEDEARKDLLCRVALNELKGIEKDLEVLEIFKGQIVIDSVGNVTIKQGMSKDKQNKIKEWLKDE